MEHQGTQSETSIHRDPLEKVWDRLGWGIRISAFLRLILLAPILCRTGFDALQLSTKSSRQLPGFPALQVSSQGTVTGLRSACFQAHALYWYCSKGLMRSSVSWGFGYTLFALIQCCMYSISVPFAVSQPDAMKIDVRAAAINLVSQSSSPCSSLILP